jgi:hypothetical protein
MLEGCGVDEPGLLFLTMSLFDADEVESVLFVQREISGMSNVFGSL